MRFRYTILYVDDVTNTIEFYERAFGLDRKMIHDSGDYGELATGDTILSFSSKVLMKQIGKSPGDVNPSAPTFEIAFETENVAEQLKCAVEAGATLVQEAEEMPWGQTTAYIRDINGFLVELCTAVRPQP
ncbi:VOC family protein [Planctomycetes bacterium K23_9]|uniref:Glyoxalase-like domain protein n=1 Tax=Stieleria marina TaxID=1930275 RepID=A0A517NU04_9BACT|nr:Glyoxalase-like domain protein [Planctomycetes bacterium K23_9]